MAANGARYRGWVYAMPWIIGMGCFTVYPFCASMYYSMTDFSVLREPLWVGTSNFREIADDKVFWQVMSNTMVYVALALPSGLIISLCLALMLNAVRRGQVLYSVVFYLPHLMPPVASAVLWQWIFNAESGLLNNALRPVVQVIDPKFSPPAWFGSTTWAIPALIIMALWGVGQTAFIYLAKLQDVPQEMYEAAEIDGASTWQKIRHITLPTISPVIFFTIVMGIIGAFQVFTGPYLISKGGPARASTFQPQYIWDNAFLHMRMGYACAVSWILFLIILALTWLAFRLSRDRVYYAGR